MTNTIKKEFVFYFLEISRGWLQQHENVGT